MNKQLKVKHLVGAFLILFLALAFVGTIAITDYSGAGPINFDGIKFNRNVGFPSITFSNGDSASSRTSGRVDFYTTLKVKSIISDTTEQPSNLWRVSPAFTYNKFHKLAPTIKMACDSISSTDSNIIYVYEGYYSEVITLRSKMSIIGADRNKVKVVRTQDSCAIYGYSVNNVSISNMTIINKSDTSSTPKATIKLRKCYQDSTARPTVIFDNLTIQHTPNTSSGAPSDYGSCIYADSSSFIITNSFIHNTQPDMAICVRLAKSSRGHVYNCQLVLPSSGALGSSIFFADDTRPYLYCGYSQLYAASVIFGASSANFKVRLYYLLSDIALSGGSNGTVTYLVNAGNNADADFYLP